MKFKFKQHMVFEANTPENSSVDELFRIFPFLKDVLAKCKRYHPKQLGSFAKKVILYNEGPNGEDLTEKRINDLVNKYFPGVEYCDFRRADNMENFYSESSKDPLINGKIEKIFTNYFSSLKELPDEEILALVASNIHHDENHEDVIIDYKEDPSLFGEDLFNYIFEEGGFPKLGEYFSNYMPSLIQINGRFVRAEGDNPYDRGYYIHEGVLIFTWHWNEFEITYNTHADPRIESDIFESKTAFLSFYEKKLPSEEFHILEQSIKDWDEYDTSWYFEQEPWFYHGIDLSTKFEFELALATIKRIIDNPIDYINYINEDE